MNMQLITAITRIVNESTPTENRSAFVTLLVSRAIAFNLQLPTSRVENIYDFYIASHLATVERLVSEINESFVIPVQDTIKATRELWVARYRMVFTPTHEQAINIVNCVLNGDSSLYNTEVLNYLSTADSKVLQSGANELRCLLECELGLVAVLDDGLQMIENPGTPAIQ